MPPQVQLIFTGRGGWSKWVENLLLYEDDLMSLFHSVRKRNRAPVGGSCVFCIQPINEK